MGWGVGVGIGFPLLCLRSGWAVLPLLSWWTGWHLTDMMGSEGRNVCALVPLFELSFIADTWEPQKTHWCVNYKRKSASSASVLSRHQASGGLAAAAGCWLALRGGACLPLYWSLCSGYQSNIFESSVLVITALHGLALIMFALSSRPLRSTNQLLWSAAFTYILLSMYHGVGGRIK